VQLFAQVKRQFLRPLRFDDGSILLEGEPMPVLQIVVGKMTDKIPAHEPEESGFVLGYGTAKKNVGLSLVAAWLPPLNHQHEWKYKPICLSGPGVRPQAVHRLRDIIQESAFDGLDRDRFAFGVIRIS
jgi:hypothetical protein